MEREGGREQQQQRHPELPQGAGCGPRPRNARDLHSKLRARRGRVGVRTGREGARLLFFLPLRRHDTLSIHDATKSQRAKKRARSSLSLCRARDCQQRAAAPASALDWRPQRALPPSRRGRCGTRGPEAAAPSSVSPGFWRPSARCAFSRAKLKCSYLSRVVAPRRRQYMCTRHARCPSPRDLELVCDTPLEAIWRLPCAPRGRNARARAIRPRSSARHRGNAAVRPPASAPSAAWARC